MIKKNKPTIYSQFEINSILMYGTLIMYMPIILVFTYIFEIDKYLNTNTFMFWLVISDFILIVIGTVILLLRKDHLQRKVKANYRGEFFYLVFLTMFGLLGFVVIFDYLGGNRQYVANYLLVLASIFLYVLIYLGRKFFKFDFMRKK
jgi:hypothetical protein